MDFAAFGLSYNMARQPGGQVAHAMPIRSETAAAMLDTAIRARKSVRALCRSGFGRAGAARKR
jgi:hypothetical protein